MNHNVRKRSFGHVRSVKIQISLRIHAVCSESYLGTFSTRGQRRLVGLHVDAQADLSFLWTHMSEGIFSLCGSFLSNMSVLSFFKGRHCSPLSYCTFTNVQCLNTDLLCLKKKTNQCFCLKWLSIGWSSK